MSSSGCEHRAKETLSGLGLDGNQACVAGLIREDTNGNVSRSLTVGASEHGLLAGWCPPAYGVG